MFPKWRPVAVVANTHKNDAPTILYKSKEYTIICIMKRVRLEMCVKTSK